MAVQDIMLAMDRDDVKPYRYYAKRWKWSKSLVGKRMDDLKALADDQRCFDVKTVDKRGQGVDKRGQKANKKAVKSHTRGQGVDKRGQGVDSIEQIQITDTDKTNTNNINNNERSTRAREPNFKKPEFDQVMEVMAKRREKAGLDFDVGVESEKFMNHYESNGWKVGRAKMRSWEAAITNWVTRIKERTYHESTRYNTNGRSKKHVHNTESRSGKAMPGGVQERLRANNGHPKRPGEYSRVEWLREAGYSDEEIFGAQNASENGSVQSDNPPSIQA